jgi:hypothetical protein
VYDSLMDEHGLNEAVAAYMRQLIQERLTTKMLEIVDELQVMYSHDTRGGSNVFPVRAGKLSARTVGPCIDDLSLSILQCVDVHPAFCFCFLMLRGKQYSRPSLQRMTHAGSHLPLASPALEFVKAATHVMSLDPQLAQEVAALRRLLLTQVTQLFQ